MRPHLESIKSRTEECAELRNKAVTMVCRRVGAYLAKRVQDVQSCYPASEWTKHCLDERNEEWILRNVIRNKLHKQLASKKAALDEGIAKAVDVLRPLQQICPADVAAIMEPPRQEQQACTKYIAVSGVLNVVVGKVRKATKTEAALAARNTKVALQEMNLMSYVPEPLVKELETLCAAA